MLNNDNLETIVPSSYQFDLQHLPILAMANVKYIVSESYLNAPIQSDLHCAKLNKTEYEFRCSNILANKAFSLTTLVNRDYPLLSFFLETKTEQNNSPLPLTILVDGQILQKVTLTDSSQKFLVDLSRFSGKNIALTFQTPSYSKVSLLNPHFISSSDNGADTLTDKASQQTVSLVYDAEVKIYQLKAYQKKFFFVPKERVIFAHDLDDSLEKTLQWQNSIPRITVIEDAKKVSNSEPAYDNYPYSPTALNIKQNRATYKKISGDFLSDGYLVFSNLFYPGWQVIVDGKKQEILPAFGALQCVAINQGVHTVIFTYRPLSHLFGSFLSLVAILFSALGILAGNKFLIKH